MAQSKSAPIDRAAMRIYAKRNAGIADRLCILAVRQTEDAVSRTTNNWRKKTSRYGYTHTHTNMQKKAANGHHGRSLITAAITINITVRSERTNGGAHVK